MTAWQKRIVFGLAAVALLAAIAALLRPSPVRVEVARVERRPLEVTVDEEGKTRVRDRFVIAAPVAGRVERITLHQGDAVERGTVAARIYPLPLDPRSRAEAAARLEAAQADKRAADARVDQARAALEQEQRVVARARRLALAGTLSAQERELAELAATTREKELAAAEFAARAADYKVQAAQAALLAPAGGADSLFAACGEATGPCIALRSPIDGRVLRVPEESERVVAFGTPLVELGDPSALEVVVDVLSTDAVKVAPGAPVHIENWGGDHPLRARVRLVEPAGFTKVSALGVEEQRVNVIADFLDPPGALGDGYRLEARIVVWQDDNVLVIPSSALFRREGAWNVFVVQGGRARHRAIEVGHRSALAVEVLRGLEAGETVILHPSDRIDEGVRIKPL